MMILSSSSVGLHLSVVLPFDFTIEHANQSFTDNSYHHIEDSALSTVVSEALFLCLIKTSSESTGSGC